MFLDLSTHQDVSKVRKTEDFVKLVRIDLRLGWGFAQRHIAREFKNGTREGAN